MKSGNVLLNLFLVLFLVFPTSIFGQGPYDKVLKAWSLDELQTIETMLEDPSNSLHEIKKAYYQFLKKTEKDLKEVVYLDLNTYEPAKTLGIDKENIIDFLNSKVRPLLKDFDQKIQSKEDVEESINQLRHHHYRDFWDWLWDLLQRDTIQKILLGTGVIMAFVFAVGGFFWSFQGIFEDDHDLKGKITNTLYGLKNDLILLNNAIKNKLYPISIPFPKNNEGIRPSPFNRGENVYQVFNTFYEKHFKESYSNRLYRVMKYAESHPDFRSSMQSHFNYMENSIRSLLTETSTITLQAPRWRAKEIKVLSQKVNTEMTSLMNTATRFFPHMNFSGKRFEISEKLDTSAVNNVDECINAFKDYATQIFYQKYQRDSYRYCKKFSADSCQKHGQQINLDGLLNDLKVFKQNKEKCHLFVDANGYQTTNNQNHYYVTPKTWMKDIIIKNAIKIPMGD